MSTVEKKAKMMDATGAMFIGVAVGLLLGFVPALVWYGFRDALAEVCGQPAITRVSFWSVYWFTVFIGWARGGWTKAK